ncbi:tautomerase family protein [Paraburkholderia bryophila]|uniref:4-oxalocrotonate tautomerase n=1 Tax=Paraburkholderia bryophila TaxID=420952 RepID=A0A329BFK8_9BURK|nr:tautomerase family protein [Paraburkholderia bryophila]RAS20692.1 4-oxalocrotonate tautomerase [Paraburkholderia bryophila]
MPFVHVQTVDGILSSDQKSEMLRRITDLMVEIEGRGDPSFRSSVWVRIDEHAPSQWSIGGVMPTPEMIAARFPKTTVGEAISD